jgi:GNAT superfamily N-acetyltransferase
MQDVKLIPAGPAQMDTVSELATLIWNQHYPAIISQPQINYMLQLMYSKPSLIKQLERNHKFFLIQAGARAEGFISVNLEKNKDWFLNKFYINQAIAAKGIGTRALRSLIDLIEPERITLTVNRQNFKSVNFYFRNGFVIESVADFDIGNGYVMNDFVMTWKKKES